MTWRPRVPAPFAGSVLLRCMNSDDFGLGGGGDPFDDPVEEKETKKKDADATQKTDAIHLRVQQRNGRKSITTVAGLSPELDLKKIVKAVKKSYNCNGCIVDDEKAGQVLQFQGDHRDNIKAFLIENGFPEKDIKKHGA